MPFAAKQTDHLTSGGFEVPGSQSQVVSENIHRFQGAQRDNLAVVLARRPGSDAAAVRAQVERVGRIAAELPHVELTERAAAAASSDASSASITVVPLAVEGSRDQTADMAVDFRDRLGTAARDGVEPHLVGQQALWAGMQDLTKEDLASAERIGFPVVLIILLAVFGSLAAAALPLALGFASVMITGAIIYFLSQATPMSVFVTNIASMIGIGVAVDYDVTGDTRRSVAEGLRASAGTISSAALIMVAVFAVFAGTGTPSIKEIGVGMSVAIALDATLVRLILVPATMEIMGRWNWWLPKRVDRVLPHAGFEGRSGRREPALDLGR
jgi:RND superfamily putative drug exporter